MVLTNAFQITGVATISYFLVLCGLMVMFLLKTGAKETSQQKTRATVMTIFAVGALLWAPIWYLSIGSAVLDPGVWLPLFGVLWPPVLLLLDLRGSRMKSLSSQSNNLVSSLQEDANALIGIAFAFAMLMVATYASQKKEMYGATLLVLFALVICIAFVVPQPLATNGSDTQYVWSAAQRVVFAYAMGFLLTALCLSISVGTRLLESSK